MTLTNLNDLIRKLHDEVQSFEHEFWNAIDGEPTCIHIRIQARAAYHGYNFYLDILDSTGKIMGRVTFYQPRVNGIDGFTFSYNKLERQTDTFEVKFRYNNINFDFLEEDLYPNQTKEEQ